MAKKIMSRIRKRRDNRKNMIQINGIYVPRDRKMWTDDLEREMLRARSGFGF